jgi:hypothetical protein
MSLFLLFLVCFGLACVFATFGFMMPVVAHLVGGLFAIVMGEQASAALRGVPSGCIPPEERG